MAKSDAVSTFNNNDGDVRRLIKIHENYTGTKRGRRRGVEVLNKSAIIFITACWEAYVEDLTEETCEFLLKYYKRPEDFPKRVRYSASMELIKEKREKDKVEIWRLAGLGWKKVIRDYVKNKIKRFHNPNSSGVNELIKKCVGKENLSSSWHWKKMPAKGAMSKLDRYITTRGEIAHRVVVSSTIKKFNVQEYHIFIYRLVVRSNNAIREYLKKVTGKTPWSLVEIEKTK